MKKSGIAIQYWWNALEYQEQLQGALKKEYCEK